MVGEMVACDWLRRIADPPGLPQRLLFKTTVGFSYEMFAYLHGMYLPSEDSISKAFEHTMIQHFCCLHKWNPLSCTRICHAEGRQVKCIR